MIEKRETKIPISGRATTVLRVGLGFGLVLLVSSPVLLFLYVYFVPDFHYLFTSLPSDEEMIANFSQHRSDFERLAQIYREDLSVPTNNVGELEPTPEIKAIMDRIKVTAVAGDNVLWMPPDPYSTDPAFLREKAKLEARWYGPDTRKFSGVFFSYSHERVIRLYYGDDVVKGYYYVPFVPEIWDGRLWVPAHLMEGQGFCAENLNTYPRGFGPANSAYRLIQPHWYILMRQHH
jgi:hypothetical protein